MEQAKLRYTLLKQSPNWLMPWGFDWFLPKWLLYLPFNPCDHNGWTAVTKSCFIRKKTTFVKVGLLSLNTYIVYVWMTTLMYKYEYFILILVYVLWEVIFLLLLFSMFLRRWFGKSSHTEAQEEHRQYSLWSPFIATLFVILSYK